MESLLPAWMEWAITGGAVAVGVIVLKVVDRFQKPKE